MLAAEARMRRLVWVTLCCVPAWAQQAATPGVAAHENLNAVVWMQTAAEYRAIAMQTYRAAEDSLKRALRDRNWTAALEQKGSYSDLPAAVILDLDETVLDNSAFQARMTSERRMFSDADWAKWVAEKRAGLVPGALGFLTVAHANGIALFYVTNRTCDPAKADDPTSEMLRMLYVPPGRLMCKTESGDKSARRAQVAAGHRVLLVIGDDFNDFVSLTKEQANVAGRIAAVDAYERYWGERWFVLPNPTYGSWERAVGYEVKQKAGALRK